mmetsp:Transcript_19531/g.44452  ORF Transcript_19531/g.44452 Transcript_19531/m.44452 type:complete len:142 (-) Transcript_19531:214-639(-)
MKLITVVGSILCLLPLASPLSAPFDNRRAFLTTALLPIATMIVPPSASASAADNFVGKYSDPINHPGGTRTIRILEGSIGDYRLAEVRGGGGRGEPADYILPAFVAGGRMIVIDFSPKGGPRDFAGVLEKDGSIRFFEGWK